MGHNCILYIRHADLNAIADDPDFGSRLSFLMRAASSWYQNGRDLDRRHMANCITLGSVCEDYAADASLYELQASPLFHSSLTLCAMVVDDQLRLVSDPYGRDADFDSAAAALADFGCAVKRDEAQFAADPGRNTDPLTAHREAQRDWSAEAFAKGGTVLMGLSDGLLEIERDAELGPRLREAIEGWWGMDRILHEHAEVPAMQRLSAQSPENAVRAGNFHNVLSIAGIVPAGRSELVIAGQNYARFLRPYLPREIAFSDNPSRREHLEGLRNADLCNLSAVLRGAGYTINGAVPGAGRAFGQKRRYSPEREPDAGRPEL